MESFDRIFLEIHNEIKVRFNYDSGNQMVKRDIFYVSKEKKCRYFPLYLLGYKYKLFSGDKTLTQEH